MRTLSRTALAAATLLLTACTGAPSGDPHPAAPAVYDARNTVSTATRAADGSGAR